MAPVTRSLIRDVGSLTQVTWDGDAGSLGYARIRSKASINPTGIGAGNTFQITVNGGAPVTVTPAGTETTAANLVTTINTAMGSTVAYTATGGRIEVRGSTSIQVSNMSDATFAYVGLPNCTRTVTANQTSIAAPADTVGDELELVSDLITVPAGVNAMVIDVGLQSFSSYNAGADLAVIFKTSALGTSPTTMATAGSFPVLYDGTPTALGSDIPYARQLARMGVLSATSSIGGSTLWRSFVVEVPPHRQGVRIAITRSLIESTSLPATVPPNVSAYVGFAVR